MGGTSLILRTCDKDMKSYNGFRWPESGPVEAPDWNPDPVCGGGLHGLLWGEGDGSLLEWSESAKWLVAEVDASTIVDLCGKVKFPRARVVYCGDRLGATAYVAANGGAGRAIVRSTLTGGDRSTLTGGYGSTLTGGYYSVLSIRWWDGVRYRISVAYVGDGGIEPGRPYRLDSNGKFVKVNQEVS